MRTLVATETIRHGAYARTSNRYEEPPGALAPEERFVVVAASARDSYTAHRAVAEGLAGGWRFRCLEHGFVELWAPGGAAEAVTYTFQNQALSRAAKLWGVSLT